MTMLALGGRAGAFLFLFDVGDQVGHGLLHHARRFHHLRQEHLAGAEQVADHVHAVHQRAFDHRPAAACPARKARRGIPRYRPRRNR
jgi:hypothetical protein